MKLRYTPLYPLLIEGKRLSALLTALLLLFTVTASFADGELYQKALQAYRKKDFKAASGLLKDYLAEKPDPKAYYLLGYASYKLKQHKDSAEHFRQAYLIDPDFNPDVVKAEIRGKAQNAPVTAPENTPAPQ